MSHPPKIDRKILRTPDDFVKKGTALFGVLTRYRSKVLPMLGILALAIIAFYAYDWWLGTKAEKAWLAYAQSVKAKEPEKWEQLKTLSTQFPKVRASILASAMVADHYFEEAKKDALKVPEVVSTSADTAVQWYSKALEGNGLVTGEKQLLLINKAGALEIQKKYDESLKELTLAQDMGGDIKALAMLNSARVFELKGDKTKSTEIYEKISADFLNSEYAKTAKNHLRRLKSSFFANQKM